MTFGARHCFQGMCVCVCVCGWITSPWCHCRSGEQIRVPCSYSLAWWDGGKCTMGQTIMIVVRLSFIFPSWPPFGPVPSSQMYPHIASYRMRTWEWMEGDRLTMLGIRLEYRTGKLGILRTKESCRSSRCVIIRTAYGYRK